MAANDRGIKGRMDLYAVGKGNQSPAVILESPKRLVFVLSTCLGGQRVGSGEDFSLV